MKMLRKCTNMDCDIQIALLAKKCDSNSYFLGIFLSQQLSICIKNGPPPQGHLANESSVVENGSLVRN